MLNKPLHAKRSEISKCEFGKVRVKDDIYIVQSGKNVRAEINFSRKMDSALHRFQSELIPAPVIKVRMLINR